eukprot:gnl/Spiro4/10913_TR5811_c0_g1_i1.p1 gnl/Spiro4/10913_TR5811_c0_g1~~gnl/Spiro4/10913_TR5811_c0_g1_i1.p1  ORF type:complete len:270 (+),score=51.39 gnl/Spiro4/10913_TR5811_c0_g1_i1:59-811(+)
MSSYSLRRTPARTPSLLKRESKLRSADQENILPTVNIEPDFSSPVKEPLVSPRRITRSTSNARPLSPLKQPSELSPVKRRRTQVLKTSGSVIHHEASEEAVCVDTQAPKEASELPVEPTEAPKEEQEKQTQQEKDEAPLKVQEALQAQEEPEKKAVAETPKEEEEKQTQATETTKQVHDDSLQELTLTVPSTETQVEPVKPEATETRNLQVLLGQTMAFQETVEKWKTRLTALVLPAIVATAAAAMYYYY